MTLITPEKDTTLVAQCLDQIEENIINGTFAPGQKLKIDQLSKHFAVGHSPIREALSRLVASGLVEAKDNKGFRVAQISEEDVRDLYKTSLQLELLILRQAMELGDDAWEASVVAALHQLFLVETKKEPVPYKIWSERNTAFHAAMLAGCKSKYLMKLRMDLARRSDRYSRISFNLAHEELHLNHEEHKKIAQAVLARDVKAMTTLVTHHMTGAEDSVIDILRKNKML